MEAGRQIFNFLKASREFCFFPVNYFSTVMRLLSCKLICPLVTT